MNVLIAPDSFKGSLSSKEVSNAIEKGFKKVLPQSNTKKVPIADGGEGTVESVIESAGGRIYRVVVHDPLMRRISSFFGILDDGKTAVIEMAAASGIGLLRREEQDPWYTTSYGTGELIKAALDRKCSTIILGIGGSATNDAGAGMLSALGVKLTDKTGSVIKPGGGFLSEISSIDVSDLDKRINNTKMLVACDVNNPLTGESGSSFVYGPQKGADKDMILKLDNNLKHFASLVKKIHGRDIETIPGSGAAGGIGGGLLGFLDAELMPGFELISQVIKLEKFIKDSHLVITGEGKIDNQTIYGKAPAGILKLAKKYNIPVIAVTGQLESGSDELYEMGFQVIMPIVDKPMNLEEAFKSASFLLEDTGERIARFVQLTKLIPAD
jgi:glycerate kinase